VSVGWTGMRGIARVPSYVIMQPTTLCNLDCLYCYLPHRAANRRMPVAVARAVAATVNERAERSRVLGGLARGERWPPAAHRRPDGALRRRGAPRPTNATS
jgi:hypothetical protein